MPRQHGRRSQRSSYPPTDGELDATEAEAAAHVEPGHLLQKKDRVRHRSVVRDQILFVSTLGSNLMLACVMFASNRAAWGLLVLGLVLIQYLCTWGLTVVYVRTMMGGRHTKAPLVSAALAFGPIGLMGIDVLMFADSLSAIELEDVDFEDLVDFVPSFRASRVVFAAVLESMPMLLVHACFAAAQASKNGLWASSLLRWGMLGAVVRVSIVLNLVTVLLTTWRVLRARSLASMSLLGYLSTVLDIGAGIPLHAIYTNTISEYTLLFEPEHEELRQLCAIIAANQSLNALNLSSRGVSDDNAMRLAAMVGRNPCTRMLWLGRNRIGDHGASAIAEAVCTLCSLQEIKLWDNRIGDRGAHAFGEMLRVTSCLHTLVLFGNRISDLGAESLALALAANGSLRKLGLSVNNIGDKGALAFAQTLRVNGALRELNLAYNQIGDQGARALADMVGTNRALTELGLWDNSFSNESEEMLHLAWVSTGRKESGLTI